jgi:hypothetical protein
MDQFNQLLVRISVFKLVVDISEVINIEITLSLDIEKSEVSFAALLIKWISLNDWISTMRRVSYFKKDSKSRACP